jgi:parvulin-like peptidyl-prolyl isomerase
MRRLFACAARVRVLVSAIVLLQSPGASAEPAAAPARAEPAAPARTARAPIPLDGIAALVDDVTIFRSDVAARVRHFEAKLSKDPVKRRIELAEASRTLLSRMIDEVLINKDAARLHVEASDADVTAAIGAVAQQNNMDRKTLDAEVAKAGFSALEYRDELRRQIIEQKWLMVRAGGKIDRKKAPDAASFQAALEKEREALLVDLRSHAFIEVR